MLRCIVCNKEYKEKINLTNDGCAKSLYTTLYRTTIPNFMHLETPLEKKSDNLWLKREDKGDNRSSFKDRKTKYVLSTETLKFALASCGNQALSLKRNINFPRYDIKLFLPNNIPLFRLEQLCIFNPTFTFGKILSTNELIEGDNTRWNITNGMDPIGASAIYSLGMELEKGNFDNIVVPMGSGELYSMLSVYFKILRNKKINIIPVKSTHPLAYAINTDFIPMTPFIEHFNVKPIIMNGSIEYINQIAKELDCDFSSAMVFGAVKHLNDGKTCLVITGAKN